MKQLACRMIAAAALLLVPAAPALAQGQDSTPGERNLRIFSELFPGIYSSANQALFDARRGLSEEARHGRQELRVERLEDRHQYALTGELGSGTADIRMTLSAGPSDQEFRASFEVKLGGEWSAVRYCELRLRRRAEHFDGRMAGAECPGLGFTGLQLSREELWLETADKAEPFWYERAREFHCYADLPGVSGGRDIPFERYDGITLHDKGATHWFTTRGDSPREIGITLQAITWHVLNERGGNFNRNSLVLYASERMPDGSVEAHPYAFTEPDAERIGYNLRWMLVNCAITPRDQARPEM